MIRYSTCTIMYRGTTIPLNVVKRNLVVMAGHLPPQHAQASEMCAVRLRANMLCLECRTPAGPEPELLLGLFIKSFISYFLGECCHSSGCPVAPGATGWNGRTTCHQCLSMLVVRWPSVCRAFQQLGRVIPLSFFAAPSTVCTRTREGIVLSITLTAPGSAAVECTQQS